MQCGNCSAACPEKVDCAGLIAMLRAEAGNVLENDRCRGCGRDIPALPVRQWLQNTLDPDAAATEEAHGEETRTKADPWLCPVCRRQVYAANNAAG